MKILLFHGYMLRGTGSNIYTANLARALARLGHEVHLLCQDREVKLEDVRIHNPDIHGLLPIYVKDPYEGFEVKAFPELTDAELDRYLEANVAAVRELAASVGGFDAALAGHLVMGVAPSLEDPGPPFEAAAIEIRASRTPFREGVRLVHQPADGNPGHGGELLGLMMDNGMRARTEQVVLVSEGLAGRVPRGFVCV